MPRFAAPVFDLATAVTLVSVVSWWVSGSDDAATAGFVAAPLLVVLWEALWLRLTGGTVRPGSPASG
ncbi:MAG TPA: hypothetical protein VIL48_10545 [Acidimicrobiales bacterium]